ncbi:MAG: hypothetical protein KAI83_20155 [Thiomargarita sp.]|nr:hypothetical protein [Thiomargarita sp.]
MKTDKQSYQEKLEHMLIRLARVYMANKKHFCKTPETGMEWFHVQDVMFNLLVARIAEKQQITATGFNNIFFEE